MDEPLKRDIALTLLDAEDEAFGEGAEEEVDARLDAALKYAGAEGLLNAHQHVTRKGNEWLRENVAACDSCIESSGSIDYDYDPERGFVGMKCHRCAGTGYDINGKNGVAA